MLAVSNATGEPPSFIIRNVASVQSIDNWFTSIFSPRRAEDSRDRQETSRAIRTQSWTCL